MLVMRGRLFVLRWGEVKGRVPWSDRGGCWRVEGSYLDKVWQMGSDGLIWTQPPRPHPIPAPQTALNIGTVFVHLERRGRGRPVFHKDRLIAGVVEWRGVGRGEVEEGWCCTLIPHIDLWPQHQPTCLEFHYRRRKTDGGRGASGSFWGLPPQ